MPTLGTTNRVQLRYIPEATFGVTPVAGNSINLRMTGESLDYTLTKDSDKEIRQDRQRTSATTTNADAVGDVKVHIQYAEYDKLFAALLQSAWAAYGVNGVGTTFTSTATATTLTAAVAPTTTSAFTTLQKGQWFQVQGAGLNVGKYLRVSTVTAPTSTVITLDPNTPALVETSVAGVMLSTSRLTNGTTQSSFTLERSMNDIVQFMAYRGMTISKFSTSFASGSLTEGSFSFMGKDMIRGVVTTLPGTPVASQAYDIQNAVTGVGNIWEAGVPLASSFIKTLSLDIDNTMRAQEAIGVLGNAGLGTGTFVCKGSLELYFADGTMFDKFLSDTYTSLSLYTRDKAGNGYVFTLPKVMLTAGKVQSGAKDTDLMATFDWEAYADLTNAVVALQQTVFIDRLGVAVP